MARTKKTVPLTIYYVAYNSAPDCLLFGKRSTTWFLEFLPEMDIQYFETHFYWPLRVIWPWVGEAYSSPTEMRSENP